jgi:UDP-2,3-diacylglucosamine pyrophosphatase LpxH
MRAVSAETLIISDVHLGSDLSRARDALRLIKHSSFQRLILLGDIFADLNFSRLKKDHWRLLSHIRKLSNPKRGIEVVWVEGNHDQGLSTLMSHLVGVRVYQEYTWSFAGLRHLAIHGHQFDQFAINRVRLSRFGTLVHLQLQKLDSEKKRFSRLLDGLNTRWLRLSAKVSKGALEHARRRGADRIFCGHTHIAMEAERDGVRYYNSGSWVGVLPTFITVGEEGVRIHQYAGTDDRDPCQERSDVAAKAADLADETDLFAEPEDEGVRC